IHWPVGQESELRGIVDLIRMQAVIYDDESLGANFEGVEIPEELTVKCAELREQLIERCAEVDDALMEEWMEGGAAAISTADIYRAVRKATIEFSFVPVTCGSAFKNKGVQPVLDGIVNFLP